jgi:ubiquinone/menaquinone biosynthesis C-methylase UbiE
MTTRPGWTASYPRSVAQRWGNGNLAVLHYKARLAELVQPGQRILHAGCGWDRVQVTEPYRNQCEIVGIDRDPRVAGRFHSAFQVGDLAQLPFADQSFDLIVSEYVVEHLDDPARVFREFHRVLKPEGRALLLTPNLWSYKAVGAALTPHWFHRWMGRLRYGPGREGDMFPTVYRCNNAGAFRRLTRQSGLRVVRQDLVTNGPTWFAGWPLVLPLFDSYHRLIAKWEALKYLRCNLVVELVNDR